MFKTLLHRNIAFKQNLSTIVDDGKNKSGVNKKEPYKTALFRKSRSNLREHIFDLENRYNQGAQPQKTPWSNVNLINNKTLGKEH
ncbi:hypothetical protein [Allomuricauda sp. F6463D]|uniref:hypothetical protein n=1 Tax=Allomuricauda sp. F6463D TaxID=2926409 RepID=UPI001FF41824|nr:hypothetical protein [Muricauda sp. F6463D]MCK0159969.1 hypothetical protein [Muricauda sp. F6463D]